MTVCSPQLGLSPKSTLGGEVFDREILLGMAKKGIKIEIILPRNCLHDMNIENWAIHYLPVTHFPAILGNILFLPYLFTLYRKNPFQVLRLHQPQFLGLAGLIFKFFKPNVKLLATFHQFSETKFGPFSKSINSSWDYIVCDSENVRDLMINKYQISPSKILVVHNGTPKYLKPKKKNKKLEKKLKLQGRIALLFMGRFITRKNPLFLLEVIKKLIRKNIKISLIYWGDGPLKEVLRKKIKEYNLENYVKFQKPLFGEKKNDIHNIADIFVHPSLDEGFALAPLEAMACAKPIVITRAFSSEEAVQDGVNGFLCEASNINKWTSSLLRLSTDGKLRKKMGANSFARVKKEFQWRSAIDKHYAIIKHSISSKS